MLCAHLTLDLSVLSNKITLILTAKFPPLALGEEGLLKFALRVILKWGEQGRKSEENVSLQRQPYYCQLPLWRWVVLEEKPLKDRNDSTPPHPQACCQVPEVRS